MNLLEIIEMAIAQMEYKHPNKDVMEKFVCEINLILANLNGEKINIYDTIDDIFFDSEHLCISTKGIILGCEDVSYYTIPLSILNHENPIKEAKIVGLVNKLTNIENKLKANRSVYSDLCEKKKQIQVELNEII